MIAHDEKEELKKREKSVREFLYFVGITLVLAAIPIFNRMELQSWMKLLLAVVLVLSITVFVNTITKLLKRKGVFTHFKVKVLPLYVIYIACYFVMRMLLEG